MAATILKVEYTQSDKIEKGFHICCGSKIAHSTSAAKPYIRHGELFLEFD